MYAVWDNCKKKKKQCKKQLEAVKCMPLEAVHTEARIITGATNLCSIDKLLADLGWKTLQERHTKHKLVNSVQNSQ